MPNKLEQLKQYTVIVADTGDIEAIAKFIPQDATTNPSLILKATQNSAYDHLIKDALNWAKQQSLDQTTLLARTVEKLMINFGCEILKIIPGRVSTEIDARLSFNTKDTIEAAHRLINLYAAHGIDKNRILLKIASTWEGIQAAKQLEREGIHCNMTLIFHFLQAVACADVGATLVSPFVGRIYDWYKQQAKHDFAADEDPGVLSVRKIFQYFKSHQYTTVIMGASFRNREQIEALAGCDYLTISPALLNELEQAQGTLTRILDPNSCKKHSSIHYNESQFRYTLNDDPMTCEKLGEGIRVFSQDTIKLEQQISQSLSL